MALGVGLLAVWAVAWILVSGVRAEVDPLAARITAALRVECGPGVTVLRAEATQGVVAGPGEVPFRCGVFVDGRRVGQGTGVVNVSAGVWSLFYEFAERHGQRPGTHRFGTVSGRLGHGVAASAQAE